MAATNFHLRLIQHYPGPVPSKCPGEIPVELGGLGNLQALLLSDNLLTGRCQRPVVKCVDDVGFPYYVPCGVLRKHQSHNESRQLVTLEFSTIFSLAETHIQFFAEIGVL